LSLRCAALLRVFGAAQAHQQTALADPVALAQRVLRTPGFGRRVADNTST
jgi:hypothetical protein